jgi:hypothetical protein
LRNDAAGLVERDQHCVSKSQRAGDDKPAAKQFD